MTLNEKDVIDFLEEKKRGGTEEISELNDKFNAYENAIRALSVDVYGVDPHFIKPMTPIVDASVLLKDGWVRHVDRAGVMPESWVNIGDPSLVDNVVDNPANSETIVDNTNTSYYDPSTGEYKKGNALVDPEPSESQRLWIKKIEGDFETTESTMGNAFDNATPEEKDKLCNVIKKHTPAFNHEAIDQQIETIEEAHLMNAFPPVFIEKVFDAGVVKEAVFEYIHKSARGWVGVDAVLFQVMFKLPGTPSSDELLPYVELALSELASEGAIQSEMASNVKLYSKNGYGKVSEKPSPDKKDNGKREYTKPDLSDRPATIKLNTTNRAAIVNATARDKYFNNMNSVCFLSKDGDIYLSLSTGFSDCDTIIRRYPETGATQFVFTKEANQLFANRVHGLQDTKFTFHLQETELDGKPYLKLIEQ